MLRNLGYIKTEKESGEKKEEQIRLIFSDIIEISPVSPPSFNYLYWLEPTDKEKEYSFKFIECGTVTPLPHLDIAFDDNTKIVLNTPNSEILSKNLANNYIFDAGKYKLLFIKAWQNGSQNWKLYGFRYDKKQEKDVARFADVALEENKNKDKVRIVKKEFWSKVYFPKRFDEVEIIAYENIDFVDIGEAQKAYDTLINKEHKGDALIALWKEYSKIELEIAKEEQNELGFIKYNFASKPQKGIANLSLQIDADQATKFKNYALSNTQFELVCDSLKPPIVTLIKFNQSNNEAQFEDELYSLPAQGMIKLSLLGDEIVNKRREQALKLLFKGKRIVTQNLLYAMEDEAENMFDVTHKPIQDLSPKTKRFLKEKFGIDELTPNQRAAVSLAINNTNDITIIQGPPGTGKTTVISAICYRLLELADKKNKSSEDKAILASAFQNDTVEHLASKIYTHGLPTVKVGRRTLGLRAEEIYIKELDKHLTNEIDKRGGKTEESISQKLNDLKSVFIKEKNIDDVYEKINDIIDEDTSIKDVDFESLGEIKRSYKKNKRNINRCLSLVESLPTDEDKYNFENGFQIISDILQANFELEENDLDLLNNAPDINPEHDFLESLRRIKNNLTEKIVSKRAIAEDETRNEIIQWMNETIHKIRIFEESNYDNEDEFIKTILSELKTDLEGNTPYIRRSLQEYGETIAATNQLAGSREMMDFQHIENVILEEAARSNPLDLIIPMIKAEKRIILVGDQNQLPHLLESEVAERSLKEIDNIDEKREKRNLYEQSLFGIIFKNVKKGKKIRAITLEEQFRMHPTIGDFISKVYYEGKLRAGAPNLAESKMHNLSISWAKNKTMIFCNVGNEFPEGKGQSKHRKAEAEKIMWILGELRKDPQFENLSVGIIAFYSRQVSLLFEEASKKENGYSIKTKDGYDIHPNYKSIKGESEKLRIGTVDSFQGKEFDIVILSTVRSNSIKRIEGNERSVFGFLTLKNRLNVAFSRAKKMVIVVGDEAMYDDEYAKSHVYGLYELCSNITKNKEYGNRI